MPRVRGAVDPPLYVCHRCGYDAQGKKSSLLKHLNTKKVCEPVCSTRIKYSSWPYSY